MIRDNKSCPGCHFKHPKDSTKLKFHQEVGFPALVKHGYLCRKDVTASAKILDKFNTKFPQNTDPAKVLKPAAKIVSDDSSSDQILAKHVHSPSNIQYNNRINNPASFDKNSVLLMPNRPAPPLTSNGYNYLYSSEIEEGPVFE